MSLSARSPNPERLTRLVGEAYRDVARLRKRDPLPPIFAQYYAYTGMRSTARLREGAVFLRFSDLFEKAPDETVGALARILIAKLLKRRIRPEWNELYKAFVTSHEMVAASEDARRQRGTKRLGPAQGATYDLDAMFDRLNDVYFGGRIEKPQLGWTLRDAWRTHGHYDPAHHSISLSRSLDAATTPEFVVEFVLYHEMLHIAIPSEMRDGRHRHHSAAFRSAEAGFPRMKEAVAWLEDFSRTNGTARRKRRLRRRG